MLTGNDLETKEAGRLLFRKPLAGDGPGIYALADRSKPLDLNSRYCYLILCEHFASTCVVAERQEQIVGFMTGYILPDRRDTLFIWQIAVDADMRGKGLAKKMLRHLLARPILKGIRYIEATVNPSNDASRALFRSLARDCLVELSETMLFPAEWFGTGDHEQENLIRVGPIGPVSKTMIGGTQPL
jgi:L-2,4-diaminobutyric acid acetyltransferase